MATEEIPNQYGQATFIWQQFNVAREYAVTLGYQNPEDANPATVINTLQSAFTSGANGIFDAGTYTAAMALSRIYVLQKRAGILESFVELINQTGSGSFTPPPPNVTIVVAKQTARAGRQFRGRWALPNGYLDEEDVDAAGLIDSGRVSDLQSSLNGAYGSLIAAGIFPALLHAQPKSGTTPTPTPITAFLVRSQVGTDRKRIKRLAA